MAYCTPLGLITITNHGSDYINQPPAYCGQSDAVDQSYEHLICIIAEPHTHIGN